MAFSDTIQAAKDFWRPNRFGLVPYLIKDEKTHPFAVICPGGAYNMVCSFVEGKPIAEALNDRGYHAFVVYYRTRKKSRYPNPQEDLKQAVGEILTHSEEWKLDPDGWSLWGSSAGGHLAASYCTEEWGTPKPAAMILSYPVITMGALTHDVTRKNMLGKEPDQAMIQRLSVECNIRSDFPPTFVWNGTADDIVDPENSRMLEAALIKAGVPHRAEQYEGIGHGVGLAKGTNAECWIDHAVAFWEQQRHN